MKKWARGVLTRFAISLGFGVAIGRAAVVTLTAALAEGVWTVLDHCRIDVLLKVAWTLLQALVLAALLSSPVIGTLYALGSPTWLLIATWPVAIAALFWFAWMVATGIESMFGPESYLQDGLEVPPHLRDKTLTKTFAHEVGRQLNAVVRKENDNS